MVRRFGTMGLRLMKETLLRARRMAGADSAGVMAPTMRETSLKVFLKA